ncbi:MAG: YitT family protein [Eubacterium sp.]|nr:YitT family protein [Eubacterium sp.]
MSIFILFGNALLAFAVTAFIMPHDIVMGGTTGIAIMLNRLFGVNTALTVFVLNTILLFIGLLIIGKKLFFSSIASTLLYPSFLALMQKIPNVDSFTDNPLLSALFAGVLMGLAIGLVMRVGSSTGGMDIANLVAAKLFHKPVAVFVYVFDFSVIGAQAAINAPEQIMLGIVVIALESFMLDKALLYGQSQLQVFVVSPRYREIRLRFLKELKAGVTLSYIQTGALGEKEMAVVCVIPTRKLYYANEIVRNTDPEAFITITKIKEVRGRGFTSERTSADIKEIS